MRLEGNIISGEFDGDTKEFSLQQVKHLTVESAIKESQLKIIYDYLKKHENDRDGQVLTLYDQVLIPLNHEEINLLIQDLDKIQSMYG